MFFWQTRKRTIYSVYIYAACCQAIAGRMGDAVREPMKRIKWCLEKRRKARFFFFYYFFLSVLSSIFYWISKSKTWMCVCVCLCVFCCVCVSGWIDCWLFGWRLQLVVLVVLWLLFVHHISSKTKSIEPVICKRRMRIERLGGGGGDSGGCLCQSSARLRLVGFSHRPHQPHPLSCTLADSN